MQLFQGLMKKSVGDEKGCQDEVNWKQEMTVKREKWPGKVDSDLC